MLDPEYYNSLAEQMRKDAADQLSHWPLASANFRALKSAKTKDLSVGGMAVRVMNIPSRAISTKADTDALSLSRRPCFLCASHRPAEQVVTSFEGAKNKRYNIQLNPYPILPLHFVIPSVNHTPQSIWHRFIDMLRLAKRRPGFTFLYNGPKCGASAPDHFHFQAVPSDILPLELAVKKGGNLEYLASLSEARLYRFTAFANGIFVIKGLTSKSVNRLFYRLLDCAEIPENDTEPRFNLYCYHGGGEYGVMVVFRTTHRSSHYLADDPARHLCMSPGAVDMAGIFVTIENEDFKRLDSALLTEVVSEVTISAEEQQRIMDRLTRGQQTVCQKLATAPSMEFEVLTDGAGKRRVSAVGGRLEYGGAAYDELFFEAANPSTMFARASFVLYRGDKAESYAGALKIVAENGMVALYNVIGREDMVFSVLSHEKCTDPELLRARAMDLQRQISENGACPSYRGISADVNPLAGSVVDSVWGL